MLLIILNTGEKMFLH